MERSQVSQKWANCLKLIKNDNLRECILDNLAKLPDVFYTKAASSTGKHHPRISQGHEGLYRHTVLATLYAAKLLSLNITLFDFTEDEKDIIFASLILHDSRKYGKECEQQFCPHEHPLLAEEALELTGDKELDERFIKPIKGCIASHSGQWNTSYNSNIVLPKPTSKLQEFVHMCDVIAGSKFHDAVENIESTEVEPYKKPVRLITRPQENYLNILGQGHLRHDLLETTTTEAGKMIDRAKAHALSSMCFTFVNVDGSPENISSALNMITGIVQNECKSNLVKLSQLSQDELNLYGIYFVYSDVVNIPRIVESITSTLEGFFHSIKYGCDSETTSLLSYFGNANEQANEVIKESKSKTKKEGKGRVELAHEIISRQGADSGVSLDF